MKALKTAGVQIPKEVAVVRFNKDSVSQVTEPDLTTIHYPGQKMGEIAAKTLINHLSGATSIHVTNTIILRYELSIRHSSQPAHP